MATYILLGNFTDQGIRDIKETTKRADALCDMGERAGVTVKEVFWTLGQYDVVAILEASDDDAITALTLSVGSLGNVRSQTLRAFSLEEMDQILSKLV